MFAARERVHVHARELPLVHWVMHLLMIQPRYEELAGFFLHNLLVKGRFQFRLDETRRRAVADWAAVLDFWGSDITRSGLLGRAGRSCPRSRRMTLYRYARVYYRKNQCKPESDAAEAPVWQTASRADAWWAQRLHWHHRLVHYHSIARG